VQVFEAQTAVALSRDYNDELLSNMKKYPGRYAALAAIAPHAPDEAVREAERAVKKLGFKGVVVNSHTQGEYLDEPKFWPIFEACEALDVPLYIHPNTPSAAMVAPFLPRGLDGAIYGFAVETGLHLLRIIVAGVFEPLPQAAHRGRPPRRGAAVLAVPPGLHAPVHGQLEALSGGGSA
jgi:2,3-dihydroxybenzoate decarboxylase